MLHKFRFVIAGILVILVNQLVTFAVSAPMPNALLAAGTTRYATVSATNATSIYGDDGWQDVPGMIKYITIPAGKTADVIVIFCGSVTTISGTGLPLYARAMIRDVITSPTQVTFSTLNTSETSNCAIFMSSGVTAGNPAVRIQWDMGGGALDLAGLEARQMFVIVNIH